MDVAAWLTGLGLGQYANTFQDNAVDREVLVTLTESDLRELGMSALGHRKKLLIAIEALRANNAPTATTSSEPVTPSRLSSVGTVGHEVERRHLTVMFVDLADSTAMSAAIDPEDLLQALRRYQDKATAVIREAGGYVAKFMGDGILAYFGYPQAREDAAERAVHAGLGVVSSVQAMPMVQGRRLGVRVGIATGPVVVGDIVGEELAREINVIGETPNVAARLLALAPVDGVVIAETTHRLVGNLFLYRAMGPQALKGLAEPVKAYLVQAAQAGLTRFEAARTTGRAVFVGRGQEVALLLDRWEQATSGEGQLVLVSGEPGLGKSRLCDTFYRRITEQPHVRLQYQCSPQHTNSPLYPISTQLIHAACIQANDAPHAKLDKLTSLFGESGASGPGIRLIAPLLGIEVEAKKEDTDLTPPQRRELVLNTLVEQFDVLTRHRPVLVYMEDAHWIDPTTEELISRLVTRAVRLRAMVLITFRPEYGNRWAQDPIATQLILNRLSRSQVVAMLNALAGAKALPEAAVEHIVARTDGVPLFIEEMFQGLKESGLLVEEGGAYRLTGALDAQAVPPTLQDSLMARLDRLAPAKSVAQIGAVIGRDFPYHLLAAVAPLDEVSLRHGLSELVAAGLVFGHGTPPDASYTFKHALVQDAAYNSLLRTQRQAAHRRIGATMEQAGSAAITPEVLAHHFQQASDHDRALTYWERAGDRAASTSAGIETIAHYRAAVAAARVLSLAAESKAIVAKLLIKLGNALMQVEGYGSKTTFDVYHEARDLANSLDDKSLFIRASLEMMPLYFSSCRAQRALRLLTDIGEADRDAAGLIAQIQLGAMSSIVSYLVGDFAAAREEMERVRKLDDVDPCTHMHPLGGGDPAIVIRSFGSVALTVTGFPERSLSWAREGVSIASARGHLFTIAYAHGTLARAAYMNGSYEESIQAADASIEISRRHGFDSRLGLSQIYRGMALVHLSDIESGVQDMESGLGIWRRSSNIFVLTMLLSQIAEALVRADRSDRARVLVWEAQDIAMKTDEKFWRAEINRQRARYAVEDGDRPAAHLLLKEALAIARSQSARLFELRAARDLACLLMTQGQCTQAKATLQPVYEWFTEGFDAPDLKEAKALLDELGSA